MTLDEMEAMLIGLRAQLDQVEAELKDVDTTVGDERWQEIRALTKRTLRKLGELADKL